jgi:hypothetical protein
MSYIRSYFEKNNTIIKNSQVNTAKNPTTEIYYGGGFSKFIFKVDFTELINKFTTGDLSVANLNKITHTLHLTNCIFGDEGFKGQLRSTGRDRATSFDLILFRITEFWDEGVGFDYVNTNADALNGFKVFDQRPSTWYDRTTLDSWSTSGIYAENPTIIQTIHFDNGNEDIDIDITEYVNGILFSGQPNNGICIAYSANTESLTAETKNVVTFFSKYTQTFFEPFLETTYDDRVNDENCCLKFDETSNFYFISQAPITSVNKFELIDSNNEIIYSTTSQTSFIKLNYSNYKTSYFIDSENYEDQEIFYTKWYYTQNGKNKVIEREYNISRPDLNDDSLIYSTEVFINVVGIKQNDIISKKAGLKRLIFKAKRLIQTKILKNIIGDIEFRIYVNQGKNQIDVIPFTKASKVNDEYFAEIDFSWFISHDYTIEVRGLDKNGFQYPNSNYVKFRVTN